jgi:hypothetical protein
LSNRAMNELALTAERVELVYDQHDSNAANFVLGDGYFSIQTSVYLEADEQLNEPFIELNNQSQVQCGGLESITFFNDRVLLSFGASSPFLKRYRAVVVHPKEGVLRELVDFFNNHLFLGSLIRYSDDFDPKKVCVPTAKRELL